jgi:YspA, cpYpsA-related SLOG family
MRIIIAGERHWNTPELAEDVVNRLLARYGPELVIVRGGAPGIDQSFAVACRELGVMAEVCLPDFSHVGDHRFQNEEMLRPGVRLCLIFHRAGLDERCRDLAQQAIEAEVPTFLIDNEDGKPRRLTEGDELLL